MLAVCDQVAVLWNSFVVDRTQYESSLHSVRSLDGDSGVAVFLDEARARLEASTIEIGVFGNVKRGKSTLLNALVGEAVSSVRVTPETAVPVWVENGHRQSQVVFSDGTIEDVDDASAAALMATQRHQQSDGRRVLRVIQRLPLDWMPIGLRIVDTPGLDDPSQIAEYEDLTLAELDRVAAAVFVFVSPPGPAGEEIRLLRSLRDRNVDKSFLVCNFYPDHWRDAAARRDVSAYLTSIVAENAGVDPSDAQIYEVSARQAFDAAHDNDADSYSESGVQQLRDDLERFLTRDALPQILGAASRCIESAKSVLEDALLERERVLNNPALLTEAVQRQSAVISESKSVVQGLVDEVRSTAAEIRSTLVPIVKLPFDETRQGVETATSVAEAEAAVMRLRLRVETAASRSSRLFDQRTVVSEQSLQRRLFESLEISDRIESTGSGVSTWADAASDGLASMLPSKQSDWGTVGISAGVTAVGGGLIGGSLAGGVGIALLAAGPVGWLVGLAAGAALGAVGGGVAAATATRRVLGNADRLSILASLSAQESHAMEYVETSVRNWVANLTVSLERLRENRLRDQQDELERLGAMVEDRDGLADSLAKARSMLQLLRSIQV